MASTKKVPLNKKLAVGGVLVLGGLLIGLSQFGGDGLEGRVRQAADSTPLPDLLVQDISVDSSSILNVKVGNIGKADVTAGTAGHTYIWINDGLITSDSTPKWTYSWTTLADQSFLKMGSSATIQPQTLTGTYTVKACVDPKNVVKEYNENNNCLDGTLADGVFTKTVSLPDLAIDSVSFDSSGHITVKVTNKGKEKVTAGTSGFTSISIDGTEKWTYNWSTLSDTAFFKIGGTSTIQPETLTGTHTIKACVDTTSLVTESDETNNCTESSLQSPLSALPDLTVSSSDISVSSTTGSITVKVSNKGDGDVPAGTVGYVSISFDGVEKTRYNWTTLSDQTFLTAGGSSDIYPGTFTGTHTVKICMDSTSVVTESDETNNCTEEVSLTSPIADSTGTPTGGTPTGGTQTGGTPTGGQTGGTYTPPTVSTGGTTAPTGTYGTTGGTTYSVPTNY